jgi:N-acetylglucosamine-6-phosphate deacetylase
MKIRLLFFVFYIACFFASTVLAQSLQNIEGVMYSTGKPVLIKVIDGKIAQILPSSSKKVDSKVFVAPGLFDIQINGYMGVDFSDQELTIEKMKKATEALWKEGVTSFLPTIITSDRNRLEKSFTLLNEIVKDKQIGNSIPGFHLEGPYISPVQGFRGVHSEKHIRKPDWVEFEVLQEKANGKIKLVTLSPEFESSIEFIKKGRESGVRMSLGHHNGNSEQINEAVKAGACLSTHLGNGCANEINRHNNPIWPQLSNDGLSVSIIADGSHLNRDEVRTFFKAKGVNQTILVSDALSLAGMPPGEYLSNDGQTLLLTKEVVKYPAQNVLAGAASPISLCIGKMMNYTGCSLKDAIQMASTNPAKLMGLSDRGEIKQGKRADLILFTIEAGNIVIQKTVIEGKIVYEK